MKAHEKKKVLKKKNQITENVKVLHAVVSIFSYLLKLNYYLAPKYLQNDIRDPLISFVFIEIKLILYDIIHTCVITFIITYLVE